MVSIRCETSMNKGTNWTGMIINYCAKIDCWSCHLGVSICDLADSWNNLGGVAHHENQDDHHGDAGQPEFPLPQGVVASPGRVEY